MGRVVETLFPSTVVSYEVGGANWQQPSNAVGVPDNALANASYLGGNPTDCLWCLGFTPQIPDGATPLGHVLTVYKRQGVVPPTGCTDLLISFADAFVPIGDNKADTLTEWPLGVVQPVSYPPGGNDDLWGISKTPAEYRAANFGVLIQATFSGFNADAYVDAVRWHLAYDVPGQTTKLWWGLGGWR